jgi:lysophospholipase L1-like esterase
MIGWMIRDVPADFISMCLGINVWGGGSLNARTFRPAVFGLMQLIRDAHPAVPVVLMSGINLSGHEGETNTAGFTLQQMREEVAAAVEVLRSYGDRSVYYVDGRQVFGPELARLQPDGVHPDAEGYKALGQNFLDEVIARYFPRRRTREG